MAADDKVVIGLTHAGEDPESVLICFLLGVEGATWGRGAEVKGAPSLYEFTQGGVLTFNY